ncbi:MAG: flagellar motor switch protein FliM [Betaproteobacteria bacterium]|nr:flagellar motor switch protein FliM [Betaproteobacteria bacterium]
MSDTGNLLTPEEIEALSAGVADGSVEVDTGFNLNARVAKHDLASEDSSVGINLSAIDMINERFVRLFRLGLLEVLRTSPRINPARSQLIKFRDYMKLLRAPLSVNVVRMNPLRGFSMAVIEPTVVFSALDNFFGGFGRGVGQLPPGRLFTPTESRIIKMMLDVLFRSLQDAWSPLMDVDFEVASSEINPQFAQIADENDLVILNRFEVESGSDSKGLVDIVHPYGSLKPIRDLLRSRVQTGDGNEESERLWRQELFSAVGDSTLEMTVLLGKAQTTLKRFTDLRQGDVLYLRKPEHVRVLINDIPAYEAQVGRAGPSKAIRIDRTIKPEQ